MKRSYKLLFVLISVLCFTCFAPVAAFAANLQIGQSYKGGKIAYIDSTGRHGLIAAAKDQSTAATWTQAKSLCANLVSGGYSDWRLPKKDELHKLYHNRTAIGGFRRGVLSEPYWSSSEYNRDDAWVQYFTDDLQCGYGKNWHFNNVRAVRSF